VSPWVPNSGSAGTGDNEATFLGVLENDSERVRVAGHDGQFNTNSPSVAKLTRIAMRLAVARTTSPKDAQSPGNSAPTDRSRHIDVDTRRLQFVHRPMKSGGMPAGRARL
jgi:hypothetical protein